MDHAGELVADASWECLWSDIASVDSHLLISDWLVDDDQNELHVADNGNGNGNSKNGFLLKTSMTTMMMKEDLDDDAENDDDDLSFSSLTTTNTATTTTTLEYASASSFEPPRKKMKTHFDADEGLSHCRVIAGFMDDQSSSQPASSDQSTWIITNDEFMSSFEDTVEQQSSAFFYKKEATPESATPDHFMSVFTLPPASSSSVILHNSMDFIDLVLVAGNLVARLLEDRSDVVTSDCNISGNRSFSPTGAGRRRLTFCSSAPAPLSSLSPDLDVKPPAATSSAAGTVVYPFAVLKPSWMQGHVTLRDINERILTPTKSTAKKNSPCTFSSARKDCKKSIIALTKIHTEGLGLSLKAH